MSSDNLPCSSQAHLVSRKLLLENPFVHHNTVTHQAPVADKNNLSGNVLMLLSILVCGIICSLGLHYIIRCAFRRSSSFMIPDPISIPSTPPANKGIKKKALKMFPVVNYSPENEMNLGDDCVICLSDFAAGEQLRLLPKCNHGFHVRCIDKWLTQHLTCPKCRHCLVDTCQKILGDCDEAAATTTTALETQSIDIRISPLQPEARVGRHS